MAHIDADQLALIGLGELAPSDDESAHVASCAECAVELRELQAVVHLGRSAEGESLATPPPAVWQRIQAEIEDGAAQESLAAAPHMAAPHVATGRWRRRWSTRFVVPVTVAALVVGIVAGTGIGSWWQASQTAQTGIAVAGAELDPFPDWADSRGSAVVEVLPDGTRQVVVDVDTAGDSGPSDAQLREVWLISGDGTQLVSIGYLDGVEGVFTVPSNVDLADYSLVDVSAEPDNGDTTHSGNSIVRGELRTI
ncbi:anti-sigma factor [Agreia sp. Leaf335]|uniref:anti-sigma factor n=1 Tax=Agreia sp. Leaf335 TaxID=1736340 RepID=UPI0009EB0865|nr:anti-sigma factor [Agreia sp. Leaf335]